MQTLYRTFAGVLLPGIIGLTAVTLTAASGKVGIGPDFKGPIGLQLYSLRDALAKDVPGTLEIVHNFGIRDVELAGTYDLTPKQFKPLLEFHQLKAISGHFPYERYRDDLEAVVHEAEALGLKYAGCAWIPHEGDFDEATCRKAIAVFNQAGERLRKAGIQFFYHQHGYEFRPYQDGTLLDLLMKETDSKNVAFEMDIFWVRYPGQDPVVWLNKYGKRWQLMHLKDMKQGVKLGDLSGHADVESDVALGQGQLDLPAILRAAKKAGVKWYFIEDESSASETQIPVSLNYLSSVRF